MPRFILLDAGVIGQFCASPTRSGVADCRAWVYRMTLTGASIAIPEVTYFEVRRGLLWNHAIAKLKRFDLMLQDLPLIPITLRVWARAAEFWALMHRTGQPTAAREALDADAIFAALAVTITQPADSAIIATTNVGHLSRFPGVDARLWTQIE